MTAWRVLTHTFVQTILHYMVGSEVQRRPTQRVLAMLERSGLMFAASVASSP